MEMSTKYNPTEVEKGKYEKWVKSGLFKSDVTSDKPPVLNRNSTTQRNG